MTNLTFAIATFLRFQTIGLEETKIDYGFAAQVSNPQGYGISLNLNNHANDSAIDGLDIYVTKDFNITRRFSVGPYLSGGKNIEDKRFRAGMGFNYRYLFTKRFMVSSSTGYFHEFGYFKGETRRNSMVTTLGIGWEF